MAVVFKEFQLNRREAGDVGVEIEVEGYALPRCEQWWRNEEDGSLKGEETREYVLDGPKSLADVRRALDYLDGLYRSYNSRVDDTVRAGVHIHINCQQLTITQLYNFITVYLILENVLVHWCGEYREGNLFCLRASDAEYLLGQLKASTRDTKRQLRTRFHRDELRYASINLKALGDYGSVEFRAMRGTRDLDLIYQWAEVLLGLREFAKTFDNPTHILQQFSLDGSQAFIEAALGKNYRSFSCEGERQMLIEGMRNAQDVAYSTDWALFDPAMRNVGGCDFPLTMRPEEINEPPEDV